MIRRIVKLEFKDENIQDFIHAFEDIKDRVNNFDGCLGMMLMRDKSNPNRIFTFSEWNSEEALNNYRKSETFGSFWPQIKTWFSAKPEAWTVDTHFDGFVN